MPFCPRCGYEGPGNRCPRCGFPMLLKPRGPLRIRDDVPNIWRYSSALNFGGRFVTLNEGLTPLRRVGGVLVKDESRNPSGSFMDRGSVVFMSNYGGGGLVMNFQEDFTLSMAMYADALGINVEVYLGIDEPVEYTELLRLLTLGNVRVRFGVGDGVVSYGDPLILDGIKSIAYELYEQLGNFEGVVLPMERGFLSLAIYEGFRELREWGYIDGVPRFVLATHGSVVNNEVINWLVSRGARVVGVDDREITKSVVELSRYGIYAKPISATAYAVGKSLARDYVVLITGSGLREFRRNWRFGGLTALQRRILSVMPSGARLTAYEVWQRLGGSHSVQGVYKALDSLVRRGLVRVDYEVRGGRKVRVYLLSNNYK
ncbi:pyridoxal-phosphate dependent enzyme [Vulcanisaeta thermophila]|uniref:pyridoxal-phosphate dependent enzyme n=1 Tax=Vulcanisaeta thermophila TaxID=867917 RepID=UPI003F769A3C